MLHINAAYKTLDEKVDVFNSKMSFCVKTTSTEFSPQNSTFSMLIEHSPKIQSNFAVKHFHSVPTG